MFQKENNNYGARLIIRSTYHTLVSKTFGLGLEFQMSFQQQQHSIAFML